MTPMPCGLRPNTKRTIEEVKALREDGLGNAAIAERLGLSSAKAVAAIAWKGRQNGYEIPAGDTRHFGAENCRYAGGLYFDPKQRRWKICCRDRSETYFARAVIEAEVGRLLGPDEHVHHINGDSTDDRVENLELLSPEEHYRRHQPTTEELRTTVELREEGLSLVKVGKRLGLSGSAVEHRVKVQAPRRGIPA